MVRFLRLTFPSLCRDVKRVDRRHKEYQYLEIKRNIPQASCLITAVFIKPEYYGIKDIDGKRDDLIRKKYLSAKAQYGSESVMGFKIGGNIHRPKKQRDRARPTLR